MVVVGLVGWFVVVCWLISFQEYGVTKEDEQQKTDNKRPEAKKDKAKDAEAPKEVKKAAGPSMEEERNAGGMLYKFREKEYINQLAYC